MKHLFGRGLPRIDVRIFRRVPAFVRDRRGVVALTVGLMSAVMIGMVGLSVDVGNWYFTRRAMQTAADAASIGGATEVAQNATNSDAVTAAQGDALLNGFGASNGTTVNVAVASDPSSVTVTLSKPATLLFAGLFLRKQPTILVSSTASVVNGTPMCAMTTNPTAANAFYVDGSGQVSAPGCAIVSDSTSTSSIDVGGSGSIVASSLCTPGGWVAGSSSQLQPVPTRCAAVSDPLANMAPPANVNDPCQYSGNITQNETLQPGVYCGGISIGSNLTVSLAPGIYILRNGGFSAGGDATVTGTGVGLYMTGTSNGVQLSQQTTNFTVSGNAVVTLSAPTSGTMAGVAIYQDHSAPTGTIDNQITGNGTVNVTGVMYFGNQNVTITGNGTQDQQAPFTSIIANTLTYSGSGTFAFNSNYQDTGVPRPPGMSMPRVVLTQ